MSPLPQTDDQLPSNTLAPCGRSPLKFFILVFALSIPFYLAGSLTTLQLLPGLPVSSLMFVCPATAALILVHRDSKTVGATELLQRSFDFKRIRPMIWYVPIILLQPAVMVSSYGVMRWMGMPIPGPQFTVLAVLALLVAFFITALGEELGWSGYVIDPMQTWWGALRAGIFLGLVQAVWHIVPLLQVHRSPAWIAWWSLGTVASRVLIVWLYNNTGKSVLAAVLFHTMTNVSWQLFPIHGSWYDPHITGPVTTLVAILVTVVWGPRTSSHYRTASTTGSR